MGHSGTKRIKYGVWVLLTKKETLNYLIPAMMISKNAARPSDGLS